jgi:RNA polymerase sigma-70 factor (ECF subfamily)
VAQVREGRRELFSRLIERHESTVFAYARSRVGPEAAEFAQDTFVEAYLSIDRFEEGTDFGAWLRAICRNLIRAHYRSVTRRREGAFQEACLELETERAPGELPLDHLRDCLSKLDGLSRGLIEGFYRRSLSLAALAEETGRSLTAVGTALHRARYRLRDCLKRSGVGGLP